MRIIIPFFIFIALPISIFAQVPSGMDMITPPPNPSAAYCEGLGYEFGIQETPEGQLGICKFSDTEESPAWSFLRGEEAQDYSYCAKVGYEMKLIDDPKRCGVAYKPNHGCLACVLPDGSALEVSNLMKTEKSGIPSGIDDQKGIICQIDGICQDGENSENCPQDCTFNSLSEEVGLNLRYIFWGIIIITVVIAVFIVFKLTRNKPEEF